MVNLYDSDGRSLYFSNRKEYYRRKRISVTKLSKPKIQKRRIRQQYVINVGYSQSVRAICINGNATKEELKTIAEEYLLNNPRLENFRPSTLGYEEEEIDNSEDKELKDKFVYLEINLDEIGIYELERIR